MAHRGPAPLARKLGRSQSAEWHDVPDAPFIGGPDLPDMPEPRTWHQLVLDWWDDVRRMPHCELWQPSDWHYAIETAFQKQRVWDRYFEGMESVSGFAEVRRREDNMGTTVESRRKLRIRYVPLGPADEMSEPVEPDEQPTVVSQKVAGGSRPVTSLASRRKRATAALPARSAETG